MKYQVGEKVKYDSGDWWFYGTITAVIENSINPCYRLNVDRMVKKNCKFSITQFEFELEADRDVDDFNDTVAWKKNENEYINKIAGFQNDNSLPQMITAPPVLELIQEPDSKPEEKQRLKRGRKPKEQKPKELNMENADGSPISNDATPKRRRGDAWMKNLDLYQKGEKSTIVYNWITQNRRQYHAGNLPESKLEKLIEINFPFEKKKIKAKRKNTKKRTFNDGWNKQLKLWEKGDRSDAVQLWRQRSVKQYVEGKLSENRVVKLKEIGILK